jgi:D-serine deaminase-like pyridoxal phosphate-dependent protein
MKAYKNLSGTSGVIAYEIGEGSITIQFNTQTYLYTNQSAGAANIQRMHALAEAGRGLGGFINTSVKNSYARKW